MRSWAVNILHVFPHTSPGPEIPRWWYGRLPGMCYQKTLDLVMCIELETGRVGRQGDEL